MVIVEQADRMQEARLQRVAGFVRHADARVVFVLGERCADEDRARVERVVAAASGEELCRQRVRTQGLGAVVAEDAHLPHFDWHDPADQSDLFWRARDVAFKTLRRDPSLRSGPSTELNRMARQRWASLFPDVACPLPDSRGPGGGGDRRRRRRRRRKR